ncbi:unnamed protein product [Brassica oleracea var. botrytis]
MSVVIPPQFKKQYHFQMLVLSYNFLILLMKTYNQYSNSNFIFFLILKSNVIFCSVFHFFFVKDKFH